MPELIGRLPVIAGLDNLESDDLIPSPETPGFYFLLFISRKRRWEKNRLTMNPMKPIARKTIVTAATLSPAKEEEVHRRQEPMTRATEADPRGFSSKEAKS